MDCLFCKICTGEIPSDKVYEDADFLAFLDIKPLNQGHTLIIPKEHYKDIFELPDEVLVKMSVLVKKLSIAVKEATKAEGINIKVNNGAPAGQDVFHVHFHIIPRYEKDGYEPWRGKPYDSDQVKSEMSEKIRTVIK
jgi:histidine triad (HIT) family protein